MADTVICRCDHHHQPRRSRRRRRSRMMDDNDDVRNKFKFVPDNDDHVAAESSLASSKRQKMMMMEDMIITSTTTPTPMLLSDSNETEISSSSSLSGGNNNLADSAPQAVVEINNVDKFRCPKFSFTSVCGRRRAMEDAVAIHPSFCYCCCCEDHHHQGAQRFHFFGVYDGHGCSHVAMNCKDRLHELVKEELELEKEKKKMKMKMKMINNNNRDRDREEEKYWKEVMERSFDRMDKEVLQQNNNNNNNNNITAAGTQNSCKCELQMPQCDAVGSTAVVSIVTSDKVVVANCGDSRAILCRDGKAVPLSVDHKPDLPEELNRIEEAGGRVINWDGPRVQGVLAMSRAIGDNYLKPYVSSVPEITVTERSEEDEFLIMASDGLWDVVSNDTACDFVRMCLDTSSDESPIFIKQHQKTSSAPAKDGGGIMFGEDMMDKDCSDAAMLLIKLALARRSDDNVSVVVVDLRRRRRTDGRCNVEEQRKKEENTEM